MNNNRFLPDNSRPSYTGQGLTKKQLSYLKRPKNMEQIAQHLFNGDYWAANHFQNKFIGNSVLQINENSTIQVIEWD